MHLNNLLTDLPNFSFSSKNLIFFTKYVEDKKNNIKKEYSNKPTIKKPNTILFDPFLIHKDSLFWCFYVLLFGLDKYEMIGNQHFVEEKKIKFDYIEIIRAKKDILKMHKIKPLSDLEDDLANKDAIGLKTFIALCIIANVNGLIVDNHKYYETINSDNSPIYIIHRHTKPLKFVMDMESSLDKIEYYRNHFFKLPTFDWRVKSITSYKTEELKVLCEKLGIDPCKTDLCKTDLCKTEPCKTEPCKTEPCKTEPCKKVTKKDLYEQIISHFYKE